MKLNNTGPSFTSKWHIEPAQGRLLSERVDEQLIGIANLSGGTYESNFEKGKGYLIVTVPDNADGSVQNLIASVTDGQGNPVTRGWII